VIDLLLRFGVSNLCLSLVLAVVAWHVQTRAQRPRIAHLLWLLVLVKLVTPPVLTVPVVAIPESSTTTVEASVIPTPAEDIGLLGPVAAETSVLPAEETGFLSTTSTLELVKKGLALLWLLGSACVLAWSLVRVHRFHRLLRLASEPAPPALQAIAARIARRLELKRTPAICTTTAQLPPMVWWVGGEVRVVLPASLPDEMERSCAGSWPTSWPTCGVGITSCAGSSGWPASASGGIPRPGGHGAT